MLHVMTPHTSSARTRPRRRPRETRRAGTSAVNASDVRGLQAAWRRKDLVLFLGAGVSVPYGIPTWKNLVLELLFDQAEAASRLRNVLPHYRRALASWLTDYFEYDPVILARVVETDMRRKARGRPDADAAFLEGVRAHLYRTCGQLHPGAQPKTARSRPPTSLDAVADLVARSSRSRGVAAVVTFNFDDLLERALERRHVRCTVIANANRVRLGGIPIVHPHGYLQQRASDPGSRPNVVFTEDDYHRLTGSAFHWALTMILEQLRNHTALFIGLSMSDPNLRRLLDAAHTGGQPAHWQVQKRHEIRDRERAQVFANVQERARKEAEILGGAVGDDPVIKDEQSLSDAVNAVLRQADSYDRQLFESMGVKTIWLEQFDDIPALLRLISA
jgi:SIR2-like protein